MHADNTLSSAEAHKAQSTVKPAATKTSKAAQGVTSMQSESASTTTQSAHRKEPLLREPNSMNVDASEGFASRTARSRKFNSLPKKPEARTS